MPVTFLRYPRIAQVDLVTLRGGRTVEGMAAQSSTASSLTATLRSADDEALADLLQQRPDLAVPPPANLDGLATRARTAVSVSRALDQLDALTLRVLDGLRLVGTEDDTGPLSNVDMLATVTQDLSEVPAAITRLRELALVWGPDDELRYPAALAEATGPYPAGLGRPASELSPEADALVTDAAALRRTVLAASPQARSVLDRLAEGPPVGNVTDAYAESTAETPVRWLMAHHLLVPVAADTVELPREVGTLLRRESGPLGSLPHEPATDTARRIDPEAVDGAGAAQVVEMVRMVTTLLDSMADEPVAEVKSGGLGAQGLQRLAREVELPDSQAAVLLEAAYAAGLLGNEGGVWLPGHSFDTWRTAPVAVRWARLARAWLSEARDARLLGVKTGRSRPASALSQGLVSRSAPRYRLDVLRLLADHDPGTALPADLVLDILRWRRPRRRTDEPLRAALAQASLLGIVSRDAITSAGRLLIAEPAHDDPLGIDAPETDPLVTAMEDVLPTPVDELVVQSDLSVIVPGHPSTLLTAELSMVTEQESPTVHRVTEKSLRHAMDAGYSDDDIRGVFTRRCEGELPQALTYLIDDVARRHGGLRAGTAGCYLRSEDEALLTQVLAERRLGEAGLRRLAPTVLVSTLPLSMLLESLRTAGYSPVAEDASGSIVIDRSVARRASYVTRPEPVEDNTPRVEGPPLFALVDRIRDADSRRRDNGEPDEDTFEITEVLREAVAERDPIWVEYRDTRGDTVRKLLRPISLGTGYLRAEDRRTDMLHTIAVHHIKSVTPASV